MNTSLKYGLIGGLTYIILQMMLYLIDSSLLFSGIGVIASVIILILILVLCCYYAIRTKRKGLGGFINFKGAFTEAFLAVVMISVLMNVFNYILYAFIDPALEEQLKEFTINSYAGWMEGSMPEEQFEEFIENMEDQVAVTPLNTLKGIATFILFGAIIGAITSYIMKKEDPEEAYIAAQEQNDTLNL